MIAFDPDEIEVEIIRHNTASTDWEMRVPKQEGTAYIRISPELRDFFKLCHEKHGVIGFEYDFDECDLNFGLVLAKIKTSDSKYKFVQRESKELLTPEDLEAMEPDTVFQWGMTTVEHPWFNDAKTNLEADGRSTIVKYVVLRGGIADFKIYHSLDANLEPADYLDGFTHLERSFKDVLKHGAGLHSEEAIRRIVPCTDEAFAMYRH